MNPGFKHHFVLMCNLPPALGCWLLFLLALRPAESQPVYFNTSSVTQPLNTLQRVATNGTGNFTLQSADGTINRFTAIAVDGLNGKLFLMDVSNGSLWCVALSGTGYTLVKSGLTNFPGDLALDVLNQKIYYTTSSTIQNNNTVQRMDYTGSNNVTLFTATGASGNGVSRCTAIAVDPLNSKIFVADAGAGEIWSLSLTGSGLMPLATNTTGFPTGLALDVTNKQVYFAVGSAAQSANVIQRVGYNGSGLSTIFTASGSVQRCTALDFDPVHNVIYLSDAGANSLWQLPAGGGAASAVLSGLPATAKKVRWYSGPSTRPAPWLASFFLSGTNVVFNATNGYVGGAYYVLTSSNLNLPLNQWVPVSSNVLAASGNFTLTASNAFSKTSQRQFFVLKVQ